MKQLIKIVAFGFLVGVLALACQEEEPKLETILPPTGLMVQTTSTSDGSGIVEFNASASNALNYKFVFTEGNGDPEISSNGYLSKRFTKNGLNTYSVIVIAYGVGGISSSTTIEVAVQSDFTDPQAIEFLTGGSSKTWYLAASEPAHLGVGPAREGIDGDWWSPKWFATAPFEKCNTEDSDCLCDDEFTFSVDAEGQMTFVLDNKGQTYFNTAHKGVVGGTQEGDFCYDFDTSGTSVVSLGPSDGTLPAERTRGTQMNFSNNAFMGYYVGSSSYEILSISANALYVRTYDAINPDLAWYHKFSTTQANPSPEPEPDFENLVWSDEFDVDGAPNASKWGYDLGTGVNGWGNNEAQTYTSDSENVIVEDGMLKITVKSDGAGGYTSARIKTENLYEFKYGRVEIRAKVPSAGGTWPALWMLGANFDTVGWPACGEMDIMEHVGNNANTILSTLHYTGNSGGNGPTGSIQVPTATSEFHTYTVEWKAQTIKFMVDDNEVHTSFTNTSATPFNNDFFFIFNVAMGGTLGGDIDPAFTEDSMEVDYIRVYQ